MAANPADQIVKPPDEIPATYKDAVAKPEDRRQLERMIRVFCTSLLMCLSAFPQHAKLKITKGDLDDWYQ